jgi:hypothetical protein
MQAFSANRTLFQSTHAIASTYTRNEREARRLRREVFGDPASQLFELAKERNTSSWKATPASCVHALLRSAFYLTQSLEFSVIRTP